ncbi:MAG TPA: hypothetical protein VFC30_06925 [Solirubrobacteraceae bacterium]|nr:hypothetical protein [Solirubrobacteraceae bacterium]
MPERLFLFLQLEFPWELGPPDGRYLLRTRGASGPEAETAAPERVVVLNTLGAPRRASTGRGTIALPGVPRRARRARETTPDAAPVSTARATIVDPVPLSAERQAQAWLGEIDAERETHAAISVLNRVLFAHRIASADPHTHEVSPAQALVIRAGWGEGEQVADGHWLHALELPWVPSSRARRRVAALRPQERLAELLGARGEELLCEELALRARLDLDHGRLPHAAIELDAAIAAALGELGGESRPGLAPRLDELRSLHAGVTAVARGALPTGAAAAEDVAAEPDEAVIRHALERLEAALRARTAAGFARS